MCGIDGVINCWKDYGRNTEKNRDLHFPPSITGAGDSEPRAGELGNTYGHGTSKILVSGWILSHLLTTDLIHMIWL